MLDISLRVRAFVRVRVHIILMQCIRDQLDRPLHMSPIMTQYSITDILPQSSLFSFPILFPASPLYLFLSLKPCRFAEQPPLSLPPSLLSPDPSETPSHVIAGTSHRSAPPLSGGPGTCCSGSSFRYFTFIRGEEAKFKLRDGWKRMSKDVRDMS